MRKTLGPQKARAEIYYSPVNDDVEVDSAWWYPPLKPSDGQGEVYLNLCGRAGNRCLRIKLLSGPSDCIKAKDKE